MGHSNLSSRAFTAFDFLLVLAAGSLVGGVVYAGSSSIFERAQNEIEVIRATAEVPSATTEVPLIEDLTLGYEETVFSSASTEEVILPKVTGGPDELLFSLSGDLPAGISFDVASGAFSASAAVNPAVVAVDTSSGTCFTLSSGAVDCFGEVAAPTPGHNCELLASGAIACWGGNRYGQLGVGDTAATSEKALVGGVSSAVDVTVGTDHTCALLAEGNVYCWGSNESGQLGNGGRFNSSLPTKVSGVAGAVSLSSGGGDHTCALHADGSVSCWGANEELGIDAEPLSGQRIAGYGNEGFPSTVTVTVTSGDESATQELTLTVS